MSYELSAEKARGAFFTPPEVSKFLADWAIRSPDDHVLEPSCGDASFLTAAADRLDKLGASSEQIGDRLQGIEIHEASAVEARSRLLSAGYYAHINCGDFFDQIFSAKFDVVIGNPPYIRYQHFSGDARAKGLRAALAQGVRLTALASSWAAFTVHAAECLNDNGRLGLVLPAELLSVSYAAEVRRFLLNRFSRVRLIVFDTLIFPGVLEEVILLLAEGRGKSTHFDVYHARNADSLKNLETSSWQDFTPFADEKWTSALISSDALDVYRDLTEGEGFTTLKGWGGTYLGSVTGNNSFFTLTRDDVIRRNLHPSELLKISPPGARHLRGLSFSTDAWTALANDGARCYLFAPSLEPSSSAKAYIKEGEDVGVDKAYKCKVRTPWWQVPLVTKPDILLAYMNHEHPRLITNDAGILILNSLYGVELKPELVELGKSSLPIACLNTVSLLGSEMVGRSYGGGLLKHEPREADMLPVPSKELILRVQCELLFLKPQLATAMRQNNLMKVVELVDTVVLRKHLNLSRGQIGQLRHAREGLFLRRKTRGRGSRG